jgi:sarcosine oxidase subunit gamma
VSDANGRAIGEMTPGHYGAATAGVTFAEAVIVSAWNLQGDAARPAFAAQVERTFGVTLPVVANATAKCDALNALWLGPTSWLLVARGPVPLVEFASRRDALNAVGGALFDVSASRVAWTLSGTHAAKVLAKGCPLDFHPRAFAAGTCAQSVLGHVNALFEKHDEAPTFTVMVARSYARDAWRGLCLSAAQHGYDVLPPRTYR